MSAPARCTCTVDSTYWPAQRRDDPSCPVHGRAASEEPTAVPVPEHCPLFVVVDTFDGLTLSHDRCGDPLRTIEQAQAFADQLNSGRTWPDNRIFSLTEVTR